MQAFGDGRRQDERTVKKMESYALDFLKHVLTESFHRSSRRGFSQIQEADFTEVLKADPPLHYRALYLHQQHMIHKEFNKEGKDEKA